MQDNVLGKQILKNRLAHPKGLKSEASLVCILSSDQQRAAGKSPAMQYCMSTRPC